MEWGFGCQGGALCPFPLSPLPTDDVNDEGLGMNLEGVSDCRDPAGWRHR